MPRRQGGRFELRLTSAEVELILLDPAAKGVLVERMRAVAAGADFVAEATEEDVEELLDSIAASVNHCGDPETTRRLDELLDRLDRLQPEESDVAGSPTESGAMRSADDRAETSYVLQFRIELLGIDPPIWRRIQISSESSLWDLHVAIQDAMGWTDSHLHEFTFLESAEKVGLPFDDDQYRTLTGWTQRVDRYLSHATPLALYHYDFGDSWLHEVRLEDVTRRDRRRTYPRCLTGARRCPLEDCGGYIGYEEFLEAVMDPKHPEHKDYLAWAGGPFDPEAFAPANVQFSDPKKRLRRLLQERP